MSEITLATDEAFWGDADLMVRIVRKERHERNIGDGGLQYLVDFVNGYGLSIINYGGLGVEVMVLDREHGSISGISVPRQALVWLRRQLAQDTIVAHLSPMELRDLIFDVAYWPDWRPGKPADQIGQQVKSDHHYAYKTGEWGMITDVAPAPEHPFRTCYAITWPDGDTDLWPVEDDLAQYEFRDAPEEITDGNTDD